MGLQWTAWGTTVRIDVTDHAALPSARRLVHACVAEAERVADVDRAAARLHRLVRSGGRPVRTGATLSALIAVALEVADRTGGAVDPTVAGATVPLRRALARSADGPGGAPGLVPACTGLPYLAPRPAPGWRCVRRGEGVASIPLGVGLDLTATAKAWTARQAAERVADRLGVGAMVEIGGDVATAGPAPRGGWSVRPAHAGGSVLELPAGTAAASCRASGVVDPGTGRPADVPWHSVVVRADDVVTAKALAVAALVTGEGAAPDRVLLVPRQRQTSSSSVA